MFVPSSQLRKPGDFKCVLVIRESTKQYVIVWCCLFYTSALVLNILSSCFLVLTPAFKNLSDYFSKI